MGMDFINFLKRIYYEGFDCCNQVSSSNKQGIE